MESQNPRKVWAGRDLKPPPVPAPAVGIASSCISLFGAFPSSAFAAAYELSSLPHFHHMWVNSPPNIPNMTSLLISAVLRYVPNVNY